jgi:hypothetical protein
MALEQTTPTSRGELQRALVEKHAERRRSSASAVFLQFNPSESDLPR